MLSLIKSSAVMGIDAYVVDVEVDLALGLPQFNTVGLPDAAVKESKERVRAAVKNSGFDFPSRRITVNLAPADIKKEGSAFDLPIAVAILAASNLIPRKTLVPIRDGGGALTGRKAQARPRRAPDGRGGARKGICRRSCAR